MAMSEHDIELPAVYAERDDLRICLGEIIDGLGEVQKQAIILHYFNGLEPDEIAYVMECGVGTVKTRMLLARMSVLAELEEQEIKNGQRFSVAVDMPTLPFADLLIQHIGSQALSHAASLGILSSITEIIAQNAVDY
jgi:hypothetical protein